MHDMLRLVLEFFLTGLFAFGGGLATLPFLYNMGESTGWFSDSDVLNMLAVSESTPGPIGVNMATYVGFLTFGILGSVLATFSLVLPSVVIIIIVSRIIDKFKNSKMVSSVFAILRPASTGLIAASGCTVAKASFINMDSLTAMKEFSFSGLLTVPQWEAIIMGAVLFVLILKVKLHPIVFILASAVVGVLLSL